MQGKMIFYNKWISMKLFKTGKEREDYVFKKHRNLFNYFRDSLSDFIRTKD